MTLRYDITYTTPDGSTYTAEAASYGAKYRPSGKVLYYKDADGETIRVPVTECRGELKDEFRTKARRSLGKKEALLGLEVGMTIVRPCSSKGDYSGWTSTAHVYAKETGCKWSFRNIDGKLYITRVR